MHDRNQTVLLVILLVMTDVRCVILTAWEHWSFEKKTQSPTVKEPISEIKECKESTQDEEAPPVPKTLTLTKA